VASAWRGVDRRHRGLADALHRHAGVHDPGETIDYNVPVTILSLLVVVVGIVCVGLLIVGFGRDRYTSLLLGGVITGIGVAVMHYLGMAAMRMPGRVAYDPGLLIISVVIAVVAATAALWAALELHGIGTTLAASLIMGLAVSGMHYTGMAASMCSRDHRHLVRADRHHRPVAERGGDPLRRGPAGSHPPAHPAPAAAARS
jgi:NO-binding membrane sensor protein with MHYT domain